MQCKITLSISSDTIITEDNINEVLEYLGIDSSNFVKTDAKDTGINTVGDLEKAIEQAKNLPSKVKGNVIPNRVSADSFASIASASKAAANKNGTVMLYAKVNCDGYELEYSVSGQYSNGKWTGGGSASVDIDSPDIIFVRKIGDKSFNITAEQNGTKLKMVATIEVEVWLGLKYGMGKTGSQTVTSTMYWFQSDIPS